ncbi:multicopper oxidase [Aplosporella prunicola CBS 121167]|uniref:Multicopper oxidase n=1 Tax=Aplosporella prunicola CBS 121167 TaxID=1176127 RepID=A0A6A6B7J0_9PEZI|nr:multicopper oxidase [Aplosporella prunicola CBS 121167]KAF2140132.1 multicopper oxidase [Aplosporella prunicola CBS 121167]
MFWLPLFLGLSGPALAKTVSLDWEIGWVTAAPDGYTRPVIGINGEWPPPVLEADVGDTITVNVKNALGNETTGIHWHGMWMRGQNEQDGANGVTQCSIPPGDSLTYSFTAYPAGTFWYHSHEKGQYPDGIRAPMIIHDTESNSTDGGFDCEEEHILTVSDWYHEEMPILASQYLDPSNVDGIMPNPDTSLLNDGQPAEYSIRPGQQLLFRIINLSALANYFIEFEGHDMTVVEVDSVPVNPQTLQTLTITPGQRYNIVITGLANASRNYAFTTKMDVLGYENHGILRYSDAWADPAPHSIDTYNRGEEQQFIPADGEPLLGPVAQTITLDVNNVYIANVGHRITLGSEPYIGPPVPSLYTALTTGAAAADPALYGQVNAFVLQAGDVVEVIVNSRDGDGAHGHPMHLHGHVFQVLMTEDTAYNGSKAFATVPMKRDTVNTVPGGSLVIRFRADNPGVWLFHCHLEWHLLAGMSATFIEAPDKIQQTISVPQAHRDLCKRQNKPTEGNCAGCTRNTTDTACCRVYERDPKG